MQQKPVLNSRRSLKQARYVKVNTFLLLEFGVEAILWSKVYTKGGSKFIQAYNKVHMYSTVVLYSR